MKPKQAARLGLGILLAVFFLWLIARQIDPAALVQAFAGTRGGWVALALAMFCVGYACRIARWRAMLARDNPALRWSNCAGPLLASFAANNVLPFRAGDVLRAFAFNARLGTSAGTVLATLFVERLLDLLMVLVMLGAALAAFGLEASRFAGLGSAALITVALAILVLLLFPQLFAPLARLAGKLAGRVSPTLGEKLSTEIERGLATLGHLAAGSTMARLVGWSLAAWIAEGTVFWMAALALPELTTAAAGWLALPVGTLATLIPSTPGYVGTFDYFTVRAMTALGNGQAAATAYAFLVHALLWLPPTVVGGLYFLASRTRLPREKLS
ncbi:lysylphosphatidylglycerol synthase transmembrane domain-containing protein [Chitiniphilus eburneus]|uniref:Flippase-like domain-containing protein n=1 Tax=Chitiniphilus eburneus TaxID=2571148 RepID=A0A4U0Q804_9NEIS|nr:lysylphosphatidylglycerol synthase transmembrane domain-containing protein [Chitiniphilus eburneus]TJZ77366.1 flippase-like domain-containing protein [Chitiniphilus eburneus]